MTDREKELRGLITDFDDTAKVVAGALIDEMIFLERKLSELKKQPFLAVNPKNPAIQKYTPAAKQYKEMLQQYTNIVKVLLKMTGATDAEEESPLRAFMKSLHPGDEG